MENAFSHNIFTFHTSARVNVICNLYSIVHKNVHCPILSIHTCTTNTSILNEVTGVITYTMPPCKYSLQHI